MYKCNEQRDISEFSKLDIWLNRKRGYTIRKKRTKFRVIDINKKEANWLYQELGRILGKVDWKRAMEENKKKWLKLLKK